MQAVAPDYVRFQLDSDLSQMKLYELISNLLPDFYWRVGDSDAIGQYLSGKNSKYIVVKLYLAEQPQIDGVINFRFAWIGEADREMRKHDFMQFFFNSTEIKMLDVHQLPSR